MTINSSVSHGSDEISKRGMMDQFMDIKSEHPETILFFRMGDFYELFHDDAEIASEILGLALTARDKNAESPIPMAGFPWHALEDNLRKMLKSGFKVTVAEQESELREGAKLLERVVTRVYTPGSLYEESLLSSEERSLLTAIVLGKEQLGMGVIDASTGESWASTWSGNDRYNRAMDEILRWNPAEIVISTRDSQDSTLCNMFTHLQNTVISQHNASETKRRNRLKEIMKVGDLGHLDLDNAPLSLAAAGLAADYLATVHIADSIPLRDISIIEEKGNMLLDQTTLRNLELTSTLSGEYEGSLLSSINFCRTAMGRRLLKTWILRPLSNIESIISRQNSVNALFRSSKRIDSLRDALKGLRDMERLATQLAYNRSNARDLLATSLAIERMPAVIGICQQTDDVLLNHLTSNLDCLDTMGEEIRRTLVDNPPLSLRDGGLIRDGFSDEIDTLRETTSQGHSWFSDLEKKLRIELDIPSLKVKMNRQIGWFIEVTKTHEEKVPSEWKRKQQMTNGSRYTTDELIQRDDLLLTADTKVKELEYRIFRQLRDKCRVNAQQLAEIAGKIASIDVLQCFAIVAKRRSWVRPEIIDSPIMKIEQGRHPVLEQQGGFVPNDILLDNKKNFLLITGPNMGGKSTYLRTTALISILAQSGSFVPASKAKVGLVDRVFTRVGASDDLRRGRSTFMMEMIEVAHILKRATSNSLILLDEVGRGTSTFDGLSIAWSMTEDICNRIQARSLFATHYHQLIGLEEEIKQIKNVHVQVAQSNGELKFLHTVGDGPCDDSYGVQVAALAGLPRNVVERASDLLIFLEKQARGARAGESGAPMARDLGQSSLMGYLAASVNENRDNKYEKVIEELDLICSQLDNMSPKDAHDSLYRLKILKESLRD
ncbi:MAG: DNA mismatch repair protein MutS [Candidatus Poseidoniales archaeon]|nr:MAG: DNA mismatch repair protein MutS [Candidatus Poseidoniales archaeon]